MKIRDLMRYKKTNVRIGITDLDYKYIYLLQNFRILFSYNIKMFPFPFFFFYLFLFLFLSFLLRSFNIVYFENRMSTFVTICIKIENDAPGICYPEAKYTVTIQRVNKLNPAYGMWAGLDVPPFVGNFSSKADVLFCFGNTKRFWFL